MKLLSKIGQILLISLLIFLGCEYMPCAENTIFFKEKLNSQIDFFHRKKLDSLIFKMDTLTDFTWEKLYIINSNFSLDDRQKIGFEWYCTKSIISGIPKLDDGEDIYIFTKNDIVVAYAHFYRGEEEAIGRHYFATYIGGNRYYTPQTAIFKILGTKGWSGIGGRKYPEIHDVYEQKPNIQYFIDRMEK